MKVQTLFLNRKKEDTSFTKRFSKHKIGSKCKIQMEDRIYFAMFINGSNLRRTALLRLRIMA